MNFSFDTKELVNELKNNGFTLLQVEDIITIIKRSQVELATKRDLIDLKKDLIIWLEVNIFIAFGLFAILLAYIVK